MHASDLTSFDKDVHGIFYKIGKFRHSIRDSDGLREAIKKLHDKSGMIPLIYRPVPKEEREELAAKKQEELGTAGGGNEH
jgi:hypothetical protein